MANAKRVPAPPVPPQDLIVLELTEEDARVLRAVAHRTGGYPNGSRGVFDRIDVALAHVGVGRSGVEITSSLRFGDGYDKSNSTDKW